MAVSELYLIRHGESHMNVDSHLIGGRSNETPLTTHGAQQARLLGNYLLEHEIIPTRIYSSPAVRARETARYTLAAMGLDIEPTIANDIQEMDQGVMEGRPREDYYTAAVLRQIKQQGKDFKALGGESMNDTGRRMLQWIESSVPIGTSMAPERTFAFGHGMSIRSVVSTIHRWSRDKTFRSKTPNTSFTILGHDTNGWRLQVLGAAPHLEA